jgi:hypothetical protein
LKNTLVRISSVTFLAGFLLAPTAQAQKPKNGNYIVNLTAPIGTRMSKEGDTFTAIVVQPAEYQGAIVEGKVTKVEAAQKGATPKAKILFGFSTITMPDNKTYKIQADLKEITNSKGVGKVDEEGQVIGTGNGMKKALGAGGGAGVGALAGGLLGGWSGALIGGAIGGAAGYFVTLELTTSGQNVDFYAGTHFTLAVENKGQAKDADATAIRNQATADAAKPGQPPATTDAAAAPAVATPAASAADATPATPGEPAAAPASAIPATSKPQ